MSRPTHTWIGSCRSRARLLVLAAMEFIVRLALRRRIEARRARRGRGALARAQQHADRDLRRTGDRRDVPRARAARPRGLADRPRRLARGAALVRGRGRDRAPAAGASALLARTVRVPRRTRRRRLSLAGLYLAGAAARVPGHRLQPRGPCAALLRELTPSLFTKGEVMERSQRIGLIVAALVVAAVAVVVLSGGDDDDRRTRRAARPPRTGGSPTSPAKPAAPRCRRSDQGRQAGGRREGHRRRQGRHRAFRSSRTQVTRSTSTAMT